MYSLEKDFEFDQSTGTIIGYSGDSKDVIIPNQIRGVDISIIGECAFASKQLNSIIIPEGITSIYSLAFRDNQLSSVVFPKGLKKIGYGAFKNNQLRSITLPEGLSGIDSAAFCNNHLLSVTFPNSLKYIDDGAFHSNQLASLSLPEGLSFLGSNSFSLDGGVFENNCLTSVTLPRSLTIVGYNAFADNDLTSIVLPDAITTIANGAFENNRLSSVLFPESLTRIGYNAFRINRLTSIELPRNLEFIGGLAFSCNQLSSVLFPDSIGVIGHEAFIHNELKTVVCPSGLTGIFKDTFDYNPIIRISFNENTKLKRFDFPNHNTAFEQIDYWEFGDTEEKSMKVTEGTVPIFNGNYVPRGKAKSFPICFETNNDDFIEPKSYTIFDSLILPIPRKCSHVFKGWYEEEDFSGEPISEIMHGCTGVKVLYAKWECVSETTKSKTGFGLEVYPNPVLDFITINVDVDAQLLILNLSGVVVHNGPIYHGIDNNIRMSQHNNGLYLLQVIVGNQVEVVKFVKE